METIRLILFLFIVFICNTSYCQEDTVMNNSGYEQFYRQRIFESNNVPKDTINIFLDDTSYYLTYDDILYQFVNKTGYLKYFNTGIGLGFVLKDSLPDGYYCLYNLTKKQAKKIDKKEKYIVACGEFKNRMKQGAFCFYFIPENPKRATAYKIIYFKDDVVNGAVIERVNDRIMFLGEYQMGVKHGFFYYYNGGAPSIILFKNGEKVKYSDFR